MCMAFYLASSEPLTPKAWDPENPALHVAALHDKDKPVLSHFSLPNVYYVGSHEGCGCGFDYGKYPEYEEDEPEEAEARRRSRLQLVELVEAVIDAAGVAELYACWEGDQGEDPDFHSEAAPRDLLDTETFFREREFLCLRGGRGQGGAPS